MSNPYLKIKPERRDHFLDLTGLIGVVVMIALPIFYYAVTPDHIPVHFGADGQPTRHSGKIMIWLLPVIGLVLYGGLFFIARTPHAYNYPSKVTPENAPEKYRKASRAIRYLNVIIVFSFLYIQYAQIQTAIGQMQGLGRWFLPSFLILTTISSLWLIISASK